MSSQDCILIVEDDSELATLLAEELIESGYSVISVAEVRSAWEELAWKRPELVLCDLRLPGMSGQAFLQEVVEQPDPPAFILITAFGTIPQAVEALKTGADDFLTKPLDLEHLRVRIARTLEHHRLRQQIRDIRQRASASHFHALVGQSRPMQCLYDQIQRMAPAGGPILIEAESGAGKELVAHAVHAEGPRSNGPFVPVNCASIPGELMESELFGHQAGAFTGATRARRGLFAEAHGGSLLLDEIGEMPLDLQASLLRVLQDGHIRRVGAETEEPLDVRIIAATNRNLEEDIEYGRFRSDLFYRLETFSLRIPPLRERGDDRELLASRFIAQFAQELGRQEIALTEGAIACLRNYPFPGNVRELRNAMERAVTFARDGWIRTRDLPERMRCHRLQVSQGVDKEGDGNWDLLSDGLVSLDRLQQRYIDRVLGHTGGNKRVAARILGINRRTLYRHLERNRSLTD